MNNQHDRYETGRDWPIEHLCQTYGLDPVKLRRALNLAAFIAGTMKGLGSGPKKSDLVNLARMGAAFHLALSKALPDSVVGVLMVSTSLHPSDLLSSHEQYRRDFVASVGSFVAGAQRMLKAIEKEEEEERKKGVRDLELSRNKPRTGPTAPPGAAERGAMAVLAGVWRDTHGDWPAARYRDAVGSRIANRGGEFVITALQLLGIEMTPQRLRTIIGNLRPPQPKGS